MAEIILKFELCGFSKEQCIQMMQTEWQIVSYLVHYGKIANDITIKHVFSCIIVC